MKYLLPFLVIVFAFQARAQEEVTPYKPPVTCFDVKAGMSSYNYLAKDFNEAHADVSHGSTTYTERTANNKGYSPYVAINGASRFNRTFELLYGLSYTSYVNYISSQATTVNVIPGSPSYERTVNTLFNKIHNDVFRFSFAPVFRVYNTKIEIGVVNIDYVDAQQRALSGSSEKYRVTPKHNSTMDSVVTSIGAGEFNPKINLEDKFRLSFSLGLEQEIPIQKYRYLIGVKGVYTNNVVMGLAYIGIRFSKPYTWKD